MKHARASAQFDSKLLLRSLQCSCTNYLLAREQRGSTLLCGRVPFTSFIVNRSFIKTLRPSRRGHTAFHAAVRAKSNSDMRPQSLNACGQSACTINKLFCRPIQSLIRLTSRSRIKCQMALTCIGSSLQQKLIVFQRSVAAQTVKLDSVLLLVVAPPVQMSE